MGYKRGIQQETVHGVLSHPVNHRLGCGEIDLGESLCRYLADVEILW